jgi:hypothetical protein
MFAFLAKLVAGPLVGKIFDVVKSFQDRKATEAEVRGEVEKAVLSVLSDVSKSQADVILAEIKGENWLQRNWRPIVAVSFAFTLLFYVLLMPILVAWAGVPPVKTGDLILEWTFQIILVCLGGYIGGRSLEKVVSMVLRK